MGNPREAGAELGLCDCFFVPALILVGLAEMDALGTAPAGPRQPCGIARVLTPGPKCPSRELPAWIYY